MGLAQLLSFLGTVQQIHSITLSPPIDKTMGFLYFYVLSVPSVQTISHINFKTLLTHL